MAGKKMESIRKRERAISRRVVIVRNGVSRTLRPTIPPPSLQTFSSCISSYFADAPRFQSYTSVSFIITEFRGIPLHTTLSSFNLSMFLLLARSHSLSLFPFSFSRFFFSFALTTRRITNNRLSLSSFVSRSTPTTSAPSMSTSIKGTTILPGRKEKNIDPFTHLRNSFSFSLSPSLISMSSFQIPSYYYVCPRYKIDPRSLTSNASHESSHRRRPHDNGDDGITEGVKHKEIPFLRRDFLCVER